MAWYTLNNQENNYISVQFLNHRLFSRHYTIKQYGFRAMLKEWAFEGSNDGINWSVIDLQHPNDNFCIENQSFTFPTQPGAFSHFRVRQTGNNCNNNLAMRLSGLELFGYLCPLDYDHCYSDSDVNHEISQHCLISTRISAINLMCLLFMLLFITSHPIHINN